MASLIGSQPSVESGGSAKRDEISQLIEVLERDLGTRNLSSAERVATLSQLKGIISTSGNSGLGFNQNDIEILCRHSFDNSSMASPREALKCLANVLLLESKTRRMFVNLGYAHKAATRLKQDNQEEELLNSRILFLMSYDKTLDFDELFDENDLAETINKNIARHAAYYSKFKHSSQPSSVDTMALSETLKLLFNLTQFYPHRTTAFSQSIPNILKILYRIQMPSPPLQQPVNYLINSLLNLDLNNINAKNSNSTPLFPESDQNRHVDRFITILDSSIRHYKEEQLETLVTPLVSLLQKVYITGPSSVKQHIRVSVLPSNEERSKPLGRSDTFASRLLRLSTSPVAPNLRESVSGLMFELSDQNPTTFVRNVGYGFASGFLMSHDISVPESSLRETTFGVHDGGVEDLGEALTRVDGQDINPITGQRKDMEPVDTGPEMTDEEKEREAERLFVLFERQVISVLLISIGPPRVTSID